MTQLDTAVSVQACALRIARLAVDGSTPAGATNGLITRSFSKIQVTPNYLAGQDFTERDACGGLVDQYRDRDVLQRYDTELEIIAPDPEIEEMLTSAAVITGKYKAPRTVTDGTFATASTTVTSATANFTDYDVGATIAATGIPSSTTIISVQSGTSVTISAATTAIGAGVSTVITPANATIGVTAPAVGVIPTDNGVSIEFWTRAIVGSYQATSLPWFHWAITRSFWQLAGNRVANNGRLATVFTGFCSENPLWGNGPWNDWGLLPGESTPSTHTLSRSWGRFRANDLPSTSLGYTTVPAQT